MKDSCSCGKTVYELDGRKVIIHDLTKYTEQIMEFDNLSDAEKRYDELTGALSVRMEHQNEQ